LSGFGVGAVEMHFFERLEQDRRAERERLEQLERVWLKREEKLEQDLRAERERLEQDRRAEREFLAMRLERLLIQTAPASSPTPSRIGKEEYAILNHTGRWNSVKGPGNPALSSEPAARHGFPAENCNESELIQFFTPHLNRLVQLASLQVGSPLVLVNSERHNWVQDSSPFGTASRPDMFVCHPAFFKSNKTEGDHKYDSLGKHFLFGACAHWDLRDCVVLIVEWKREISPKNLSALGEGLEYARRILHTSGDKSVPLDSMMVRLIHLMLADRDGFFLVVCKEGRAHDCVFGNWDDAGSEDAIVDFIKKGASSRRWVDAISMLCAEFKVTLVTHDNTDDKICFLGRGACGRVFRVQRESEGEKQECALKVVLDDSYCSMICEEASNYESNKAQLAGLECIVNILGFYKSPDRKFAGLLSSPVGTPCGRNKQDIIAAVVGLRSLALAGFRHGDARLPNVVIHRKNAVWLDLRTLHPVCNIGDGIDPKVSSFTADLKTFLDSLDGGTKVDRQIVLDSTSDFLKSGGEDHALIQALECLWVKKVGVGGQ
jgi:hypothetical protein